jgi:hypothetical protein
MVTTSGYPTPSITEVGSVPNGLVFVDNGNGTGTLRGTPRVLLGGDFNVNFVANNGIGPGVTQTFTVILNQAPAFTSANSTTFAFGESNSFIVTTAGFPAATLHEAGALPVGVTFVDNGNGTAKLSGTPASSGTFNIVLTATNVVTTTTQNFTLSVGGLSISPSSLNLGSVYLNGAGTLSATLTNVGGTTVTVSGVSITPGTAPAGAYTFANHCTAALKPGKMCTIAVTLNGVGVGTLTGTLNITDNAPGSPQHVSLTGNVINPVAQFNPVGLAFGTQTVGSNTTLSVQLTSAGQTPLNISNVAITGTNPGDFSQVNNCPASMTVGTSCTVSVTFHPSKKNARSATLTVTDNVSGGTSTVALTGTGR